jgi:galactokinase/galacturonokinase
LELEARIAPLEEALIARTGCSKKEIRIVCSPLRVCPLGAHVDHQDGLVSGMTLDRALLLAFVPRSDRCVHIESLNFPGRVQFDMDDIPPKTNGDWGNYARGAVQALQQCHPLERGIDGVIEGRMPIGGLSSSAAVGVAYLLALEAANDLDLTPDENIEHDRYIENVYLGIENGILDQSIILMSDRDHLTFLDCKTVEFAKYPTPVDNGHFEIVVAYSGLVRSLGHTDYNNRVHECQKAARQLLTWAGLPIPEHVRLRDVPEPVYEQHKGRLPPPLDRRARHFFTEIQRVRDGIRAWSNGDLHEMGRLINASGASSVYDYESGCPHLRTMWEILRDCPGVYGARFSGAGFRGSCIGLVDPAARQEIRAAIDARYPVDHPDVAHAYSVHFCGTGGPACLMNEST